MAGCEKKVKYMENTSAMAYHLSGEKEPPKGQGHGYTKEEREAKKGLPATLPPRPILTSHLTNFMHAGFSGTRPFNVEARKKSFP